MKVLLIGFSRQGANVLNVLIERYYPQCRAVAIDRSFGDNLRLTLPTLKTAHQEANAMIIDLDGVGMIRFSPRYVPMLRRFIGKRAAIFISKGDQSTWRNADILPKDLLYFVKSSYTKDDMMDALANLRKAVDKIDECADQFKKPDEGVALIDEPAAANKAPKKTEAASTQASFLHTLLDKYVNIQKNALLHELLDVGLTKAPQKLVAGSQVLYIYGEKNMALVANVDRLIDYCHVTSNFQTLRGVLEVEPMSLEAFAKTERQAAQNGYKKYALSAFLWQMYTYILPHDVEISNDALMLKMRYMPNFAQMQDVPEYIRALASSCLVAPRSLQQLYQSMAGVEQITRQQLNRFFVLAVLSGVSDNEALRASLTQANRAQSKAPEVNAGVAKAQKTGFLRRLLGKLKL